MPNSIVNPIAFTDAIRILSCQIYDGDLGRSEFAIHELQRLISQSRILHQKYEGELLDVADSFLDTIQDILTCTDTEYGVRYFDFWRKCKQFDHEIIACRPKVQPRAVSNPET